MEFTRANIFNKNIRGLPKTISRVVKSLKNIKNIFFQTRMFHIHDRVGIGWNSKIQHLYFNKILLNTFETRLTYNCAHLRSTKEILTFFILTLGDTGWYLVLLGQYRTVGVDI